MAAGALLHPDMINIRPARTTRGPEQKEPIAPKQPPCRWLWSGMRPRVSGRSPGSRFSHGQAHASAIPRLPGCIAGSADRTIRRNRGVHARVVASSHPVALNILAPHSAPALCRQSETYVKNAPELPLPLYSRGVGRDKDARLGPSVPFPFDPLDFPPSGNQTRRSYWRASNRVNPNATETTSRSTKDGDRKGYGRINPSSQAGSSVASSSIATSSSARSTSAR